MNKRGKTEHVIKIICTLVLATILCCSSLFVVPTTANSASIQSSNPKKPQTLLAPTYVDLLDENFTDGNMPPTGPQGDWGLQTTDTQTWTIDTTIPHTAPYCATVKRDGSTSPQNETLITPNLDFQGYTRVYLTFSWYTCYYVTVHVRDVQFNISVSTNGGPWTKVWSFDDAQLFFTDWTWYDYQNNPINLSAFSGQQNVKIAFQYTSRYNATTNPFQEFSIDDVLVYAPGVQNMTCSAGGPYEWWWTMQFKYPYQGVRFHGNVTNANISHILQWSWDFGDGTTSFFPYYPIHLYNSIGLFNVTLTVKDNSTTPPIIAFDKTTVLLYLTQPPNLTISIQKVSMGIKASIDNGGEYNASYVNWSMMMTWGLIHNREKKIGNGTCDCIVAKSSEIIKSKPYFVGFGVIHVTITANPENFGGKVINDFTGFKIGPLVFFKPTV